MEDWEKKPVESPSDGPALTLPTVSARKWSLESAGSGKASKKAKTQSNNTKTHSEEVSGALADYLREHYPRRRELNPEKERLGRKRAHLEVNGANRLASHWQIRKSKANPSFKSHRLINSKQTFHSAPKLTDQGQVARIPRRIGWR